MLLRPHLPCLGLGPKNHKLREVDLGIAYLGTQLIESLLDTWRLGDGVAWTSGRHAASVAPCDTVSVLNIDVA